MNTVLVGGGLLWRTTDSGFHWTSIPHETVHVDHHAIEWYPDGQRIWSGHDGGWSFSSDAGVTWVSPANNLPITQFYHLGVGVDDERFFGGHLDFGARPFDVCKIRILTL